MPETPQSPGSGLIAQYLGAVGDALRGLDTAVLQAIADTCVSHCRAGAQLFACGNGGSAATASHFIEDVAKGIQPQGRRRVRAIALTDSVPLLTAWANDTDYANIFAAQLDNLAEPGDLLLAISGSGNSPNIIRAVDCARERQVHTIGLAGFGGGLLRQRAHQCLVVPSANMQHVEDVHLVVTHLLYTYLKHALETVSDPNGKTV
ncbi:MAG: SIS domain-containing protein [Armatimonadetes bacterium]|jgi:D-sedoheptulose 7-phosphate isomerase|nr:SIS domain-containing protein [Armatimonadota bacterium]